MELIEKVQYLRVKENCYTRVQYNTHRVVWYARWYQMINLMDESLALSPEKSAELEGEYEWYEN